MKWMLMHIQRKEDPSLNTGSCWGKEGWGETLKSLDLSLKDLLLGILEGQKFSSKNQGYRNLI